MGSLTNQAKMYEMNLTKWKDHLLTIEIHLPF